MSTAIISGESWRVAVPRVLLGLIFLAAAIDGFAYVFTGSELADPPTSPAGLQLKDALKATGFFWPFMKTIEIVGAGCLLLNRAPAFGLALLSPIMASVVLFHLVLNPQGWPLAAALVVCGALLLHAYAPRYKGMFLPTVVASPPPSTHRTEGHGG
jgi:putative oxidoreductase